MSYQTKEKAKKLSQGFSFVFKGNDPIARKAALHGERLEELRNVGNINGTKVIPTKREKADDPRRQRKQWRATRYDD
jgi:hypothetical protein